jgi:hypothetical protein
MTSQSVNYKINKYMVCVFDFIPITTSYVKIIWLSNLVTMRVPYDGYSTNASFGVKQQSPTYSIPCLR